MPAKNQNPLDTTRDSAGVPPETTPDAKRSGLITSFEDVANAIATHLRDTLAQVEAMRRLALISRNRLENELQATRRRVANLEERLRQAETNLELARESVEKERINCVEMTTVLQAAEHRIASLEKSLAARDQEIAALRTANAAELQQLQVQRQHLEARLAEAQRELAAAKERFKIESSALSQERAALAAEIEALERRLSNRTAENQQLQEQLNRIREASRSIDLEALQGENEETRTAREAELRAALVAVRQAEIAQAEECKRLAVRVEEIEQQLLRRDQRCRELEQQLREMETEIAERNEVTEALTREYSELQALVDQLAHENKQSRREIAEAQRAEQQALEQRQLLEQRIGELELSLKASCEHDAALQASLDAVQDLLQKEQVTTAQLRAELQSQTRSMQQLEAEINETRSRLVATENKAHADAQELLGQLAKVTERSRQLEAERDAMQEQVANLSALKERLERECEQLRRRVEMERQKAEMARLQAKLDEIDARHPNAIRPGGNGEPALAAPPRAAPLFVPPDMPIIAVGASTGGPAVLTEVLGKLPGNFPGCVLIVQHMPPGYTAEMAGCLNQTSQITVTEARHGDALRPSTAFVAPGGHHMVIRDGIIQLNVAPPVNKHRPSVDVMFSSLIPVANRVCAVLLTGMGHDGVAGMKELQEAGAETVVQDEASSVVWGMPGAAVKAGCVKQQLSPAQISRFLIEWATARCSASAERRPVTAGARLSPAAV